MPLLLLHLDDRKASIDAAGPFTDSGASCHYIARIRLVKESHTSSIFSLFSYAVFSPNMEPLAMSCPTTYSSVELPGVELNCSLSNIHHHHNIGEKRETKNVRAFAS